jgi:hypothetical protein
VCNCESHEFFSGAGRPLAPLAFRPCGDALFIWKAKTTSFDAGCIVDVQFICGAGLAETKEYLERSTDPAASEALEYIRECERAGDFDGWRPQSSIDEYRRYYGVK